MNLQEQTNRIKSIMQIAEANNADPIEEIKEYVQKYINTFKTKNKVILDDANKIINPYNIIDKFKNYLISRASDVIQQIKTGQGGEKFAYDCYVYLKNILSQEIDNMSKVKKFSIRTLAGNKNDVINKMNQTDISDYISAFFNLIDLSMPIGLNQQITPQYDNNLTKWYKEAYNWTTKNTKTIKNDLINTIVTKLYS
jgi:hypothetical protein